MIVGLTGTFGAGKTTIGKYLVEKHGFGFYSCSDILRDIAKERGVEENRDNLRELAKEIKAELGEAELAKRLLAKIQKSKEKNSAVDSIRHPAEVRELKKSKNFILLAFDAPQKLRYERIGKRARPGDEVTFPEFQEQERKEMDPTNPAQQIGNCMKIADYTIRNSDTAEKLYQKIEKILAIDKND